MGNDGGWRDAEFAWILKNEHGKWSMEHRFKSIYFNTKLK